MSHILDFIVGGFELGHGDGVGRRYRASEESGGLSLFVSGGVLPPGSNIGLDLRLDSQSRASSQLAWYPHHCFVHFGSSSTREL